MYVNFVLKTIGVDGILKLTNNQGVACEFKNCLAFFDETLEEPMIFGEAVKGRLSEKPKGEKRDYFWSDLFFIFIPEGKEKTLAEMTPEEYYEWREGLYENSYLTNFAKWFSNK